MLKKLQAYKWQQMICCGWLVLGLMTFGRSINPTHVQATQPGHPSCVSAISTATATTGEEMASSVYPCYQDCWDTGLLYASLIGSNPRQLTVYV